LLSSLSQFAGVVVTPRRSGVFRHVEFLRLGERRVLLIVVSPEGDVHNRILQTARDYTPAELIEAGNTINAHNAAAEATARLNAKTMNPPYACVVETGDWDLEAALEGRVPPQS